jgi:integrase
MSTHGQRSQKSPSAKTLDLKIKRVGAVTIYQRGHTYYLYYREHGKSVRRRIEGNLAVAEATAGKIVQALAEGRSTPFAYGRTSPESMIDAYLDYVETVQKLSIGTVERYRAALTLFKRFCSEGSVRQLDRINERVVDDFVAWLRVQKRTRNGAEKGAHKHYSVTGIEYVLSTSRTAFNWARRRKLFPPYQENPFSQIGKESLKDYGHDAGKIVIFSPDQERDFFAACDEWQKGVFALLAAYGMRVGELTHLLVEDVDFEAQLLRIRSKPELFWSVKTRTSRELPLTPTIETILRERIAGRAAGFVFLERSFFNSRRQPAVSFKTPEEQRNYLQHAIDEFLVANPHAKAKAQRNHITSICRKQGWLPESRLRQEFMQITEKIGCPQFTRVHNLRHLFISRSQEAGTNVFLVADVVGQSSIETTRKYTHLGMNAQRAALAKLLEMPSAG